MTPWRGIIFEDFLLSFLSTILTNIATHVVAALTTQLHVGACMNQQLTSVGLEPTSLLSSAWSQCLNIFAKLLVSFRKKMYEPLHSRYECNAKKKCLSFNFLHVVEDFFAFFYPAAP